MKNRIKKYISALLVSLLTVGCFASFVFAGNNNVTVIDVNDIGTGTPIEHEHIYQTFYDDDCHWEQCIVCGAKKNRMSHTLMGNGGSKTLCENGYYDSAYREVCYCGYRSKPIVVIHGRYENYVKCERLNYGEMQGKKLSDIRQITRKEFEETEYPELPGNQEYTWEDPDNDGYGWVFCGGPIMSDSYGVKGTVELIVGSAGDCGRKVPFDEYYSLTAYIYSDATPTRGKFVQYLKNKINSSTHPDKHCLYGYDDKYQNKVTDEQFEQLSNIFKGYYVHASSYGWGSMCIQHAGHLNSGTWLYSNSSCYDSSKDEYRNYTNGIETICDVCGSHTMGNEGYVGWSWFTCNLCNGLKDGETKTCSGHVCRGLGNVKLGTVYCTFTREGHNVIRSLLAVPEEGGSAQGSGCEWTENPDGSITDTPVICRRTDQKIINDWSYVHYVRFTLGDVARSVECGYLHVRNDDTAPIPLGYETILTNNEYWKVIGNGEKDKISTNAVIKVVFIDADQYSLNTVSVRILDSDGTTVIKQANGNETVPLIRTSGTPGNEGERATWEGMVEICTEVNGAKLIFIQAIDATGNKSEPVPMEIRYMDCKGPEINITTSNNLDKWSKNKTITVKATDTFGTVYLGTCSEDLKEISNDTYKNTRTYVITGDTSEDKSITFYAKDGRGNVTYKTVKFSKLDNTLPTLKSVNVSDVYENGEAVAWKISINAIDKESGIMGIAITTSDVEPNDTVYKKMTEYIIPRSGKYYVWVKDNVGNVMRSEVITIHSDLIFNGAEVNYVEYNGVKLNYMYYNGKRIRL